jgi:predicted ATPase
LLESTGGNPRFLEQVIEFLTENENFFENFDTAGPLTAAGLEEVLQETSTQDIFRVVLRRLRTAPEPIQEAICIASLQGVRFSNDLVDKVAQDRI